MKTSLLLLNLIVLCASAFSAAAQPALSGLEDLHTNVKNYCLYYSQDQLCGGEEAEVKTRQQRNARNVVDQAFVDFSDELLASPGYKNLLRSLNQTYQTSDEAHRGTIRILSSQLNRTWLARYQTEVDYWLSSSAEGNQNGIVMGWLIYAVAFTATPEFRNVPVLHKFLRSRLPWSVFAVSAVAAGTARANAHAEASRPKVPPPPYFLLTFGEQDQPGEDFAAQMEHAEFLKFRQMFGSNAGLMALLAAGPSGAAIARGTTIAGRLAYIGSKLMASTRLTPVSFIVGWIVGESASWTYTQYRWKKLIENFQSVVEGKPNTPQELSVSLNGLHILYLGELDQQLREEEKARSALLTADPEDKKSVKEFYTLAMNQRHFRQFNQHRVTAELDVYLTAQQNTYREFAKRAFKLAGYLSTIQVNSDLKRDVLNRRVQHLYNQAQAAELAYTSFPREALGTKLNELFPRPQGAYYAR